MDLSRNEIGVSRVAAGSQQAPRLYPCGKLQDSLSQMSLEAKSVSAYH